MSEPLSNEVELSVEQDARATELWDGLVDDEDIYAAAKELIYLRDTVEKLSSQAPIARVTIAEDDSVSATLYAPGLPPGSYDLYLGVIDG